MAQQDIYVSVDIEADGPVPGLHSMLSIGAVAFREGNAIATFEANLLPLNGAVADPDTMAWWARQDPEAWAHATRNPQPPGEVMQALATWVGALDGDPVLVVYPTWDAMWVTWYTHKFLGRNPFGLGALDIKSLAFGAMPSFNKFKEVSKRRMPKVLLQDGPPHTHKALDDALSKGVWLMNLLALRRPT